MKWYFAVSAVMVLGLSNSARAEGSPSCKFLELGEPTAHCSEIISSRGEKNSLWCESPFVGLEKYDKKRHGRDAQKVQRQVYSYKKNFFERLTDAPWNPKGKTREMVRVPMTFYNRVRISSAKIVPTSDVCFAAKNSFGNPVGSMVAIETESDPFYQRGSRTRFFMQFKDRLSAQRFVGQLHDPSQCLAYNTTSQLMGVTEKPHGSTPAECQGVILNAANTAVFDRNELKDLGLKDDIQLPFAKMPLTEMVEDFLAQGQGTQTGRWTGPKAITGTASQGAN